MDMIMWAGFISLTMAIGYRVISYFHKRLRIPWSAEQLLAFQQGICYMELYCLLVCSIHHLMCERFCGYIH